MKQVVAVTGASGRLGRALVSALDGQDMEPVAWSRPAYDLDDPQAARAVTDRDHPEVVVHAAAWTDVDGCAREPDLAKRRNTEATRELAEACADAGARLVLISTNEVFDGERSDGLGYAESDSPHPINSYGASKLGGEIGATEVFEKAGRPDDLLIVRTAWLFGPPGNDFAAKIVAASDSLPVDEPLKVVVDEIGSPTYTVDLARAVVRLVAQAAPGGLYHLVNGGQASRLELAQRILAGCRPARVTTPISRTEFARASSPPAWAVLRSTRAAADAVAMRPWEEALDAYLPTLCQV